MTFINIYYDEGNKANLNYESVEISFNNSIKIFNRQERSQSESVMLQKNKYNACIYILK